MASFLAVALQPRTSAPADMTSLPPANPAEVSFLEELEAWLATPRNQPMDFRLLERRSVASLGERPESFQLFRRLSAIQDRRAVLAGLPFGSSIERSAERHGIDSLLLAAVVEVESNFDPRAISPRGAIGLAQVMPQQRANLTPEDLVRPEVNLDAGARVLRDLLDRYDGDLELVLAGYNAGPGAVERFGGVPPYAETRGFVSRVLELYRTHHRELWQERRARGAAETAAERG